MMGSGPIMPAASGCGGIGWWWDDGGGVKKSINSSLTKNGHHNNGERACVLSSAFAYFLFCFVVLGSIGSLYARFMGTANVRAGITTLGCQEDSEGSWAIGIFYGDSPFTLKPIEAMNIWKNQTAAWPVANPVVTCASLSNAGFPSNFVADPFLYVKDDILYLFFETKNTITMQGDIGVALSVDKGATWQQLGIALDEDWHLSYPYIFDYNGNIYMIPEGSAKGDLRLYRAINFPLKWTLHKIIMKRPLVDSFMIPHEGKFWLFGSDHTQIGARKNGHLEIWHSHSPFGPWRPHKKNPVYNTRHRTGARNGGRPFVFNGSLYRVGQDCGQTYGHHIRIFKVLTLTTDEFREAEVPSGLDFPAKGQKKWNMARAHHLDVLQLGSSGWVAVLDGDRVMSGDPTRRFVLGSFLAVTVFATAILFVAVIGKRSDNSSNSTLRPNRARSRLRLRTCCTGIFVLIIILAAVMLTCTAGTRFYGGSDTEEPYPFGGDYSQFTLVMVMSSYLSNVKMHVRRYSRCGSVREIVIVCDKGGEVWASDFDSAVPIRVRIDEGLNGSDPLLETRAVLELDDDVMMTCDDVERGFRVWREHPDKMVGLYVYPRRDNAILMGAAFVDRSVLGRYWGEEYFDCEDLLMYDDVSGGRGLVEYVRRPPWVVVDAYKIFGMGITRNKCLTKFDGIYGSLSGRKVKFGIRRTDGWNV